MMQRIHLPCGGEALFDDESGIGYRCTTCFAMVGSIGMPRACKAEMDKYEVLKALGGRVNWNYNTGCEDPA